MNTATLHKLGKTQNAINRYEAERRVQEQQFRRDFLREMLPVYKEYYEQREAAFGASPSIPALHDGWFTASAVFKGDCVVGVLLEDTLLRLLYVPIEALQSPETFKAHLDSIAAEDDEDD